MASTTFAVREAGVGRPVAPARPSLALSAHYTHAAHPAASRRVGREELGRNASDDEILGLGAKAPRSQNHGSAGDVDGQLAFDFDAEPDAGERSEADREPAHALPASGDDVAPDNLRAIFDVNPELKKDWQDAHAYRESFATPEAARSANEMLSDLDRMDSLFFSHRPEDHAELARSIASLDPAAFASLAQAMTAHANASPLRASHAPPAPAQAPNSTATENSSAPGNVERRGEPATPTQHNDSANRAGLSTAQTDFFHATNAAAVESVIDAIETQVERLLPESVSKNARNRVVGEIYRELDGALRSNRQLGQQMRDAFRSGSLDAEHQRAIVSMIAGRARQALPGVAKRVLSEWTSTVLAANQDRRSRQRAAEGRVDIAGSRGGSSEGHRATSPRDLDYKRMSDADILNL